VPCVNSHVDRVTPTLCSRGEQVPRDGRRVARRAGEEHRRRQRCRGEQRSSPSGTGCSLLAW